MNFATFARRTALLVLVAGGAAACTPSGYDGPVSTAAPVQTVASAPSGSAIAYLAAATVGTNGIPRPPSGGCVNTWSDADGSGCETSAGFLWISAARDTIGFNPHGNGFADEVTRPL